MKKLTLILVAILVLPWAYADVSLPSPQIYSAPAFRGVNLAGFEFGNGEMPPPEYFPTVADAEYFINKGMNTMRLPVEWTYYQPSLKGPIGNNTYDTTVKNLIDTLTADKVTVILDLHDYMRYGGVVDGNTPVIGAPGSPATVQELTAMWVYLANQYGNNPYVIFDLMNEPYMNDEGYPSPTDVVNIYNHVIAEIRATGANNLILLEGDEFSGLHSWEEVGNAEAFSAGKIIDPANDGKGNFAINVHQYFDGKEGYAGSEHGACDKPDVFLNNIHADDFVKWLRANHYQAMITEFGGPAANNCNQDMEHLLAFMQNNSDVFMGWTAWAGGSAWSLYGDSYTLDLQGSDNKDVLQMQTLLKYLNPMLHQQH